MAIVTGETETSSLWKELQKMVKERGWKYMWNGTSASLLLVSNPVVQFFCYEQLKQLLLSRRRQVQLVKGGQALLRQHVVTDGGKTIAAATAAAGVLLPYEAFLVGAIAKGIATVTTYPLQLAQTVLRLSRDGDSVSSSSHGDDTNYKGTLHCLLKLYQKGGFGKLFTGMRAKLLQTVLTAAFTFLTYGTCQKIMNRTLCLSRSLFVRFFAIFLSFRSSVLTISLPRTTC